MKRSLYVVQDRVSGTFGNVIDFANDCEAERFFIMALSSPGCPDYIVQDSVLMCIGTFENEFPDFKVEGIVPYVVLRGDSPGVKNAIAQLTARFGPCGCEVQEDTAVGVLRETVSDL